MSNVRLSDQPMANAATGNASAAPPPAAARTRILLQAPILPTFLRLSLPNVLNLLAIAGMITFDGLFLGQLGANALIGVSLVFPFVMAMQHIAASGVGGAVSSAIARAIGSGSRARADALAAHAFVLAIGMALVFSLSMLTLGPLIYQAMGGRGPVLEAALAYSNVAFGGALAVCMLNMLANVVRGTGNMGLPAQVLVGSVCAHIVLSPALIFGWGPVPALGPAGAGWGLVISFSAGSVFLLAYLLRGRSLVKFSPRTVRYEWSLFKDILRVGVPGMANVGLTNLSVVLITGIAGHLGPATAIGYAMGARLEYIMIPIGFGFGTALVAMIGTNWGAGQYQRARRIAWTGALTVAICCGAIGVFFAVLPMLWMNLFAEQADITRVGSQYLAIVAPSYAFSGAGMALYFVMQGIGAIVPAVLANAMRVAISAGGAFAAVTWFDAGATGIFVAIAAGFVAYGLANAWLLLRTPDPATRNPTAS